MKKIIIFSILALLLTGCDSFLDTENLTQKDTSNFPENKEEMMAMLTGVYSAARNMEMDENAASSFVVSEILSDDRFTGGGPDDKNWSNLEKFVNTSPNMFDETWSNAYKAIYRANTLLLSLDKIQWDDPQERSYIEGQAYFLRGYTYFYLARFFGSAPIVLTPEPVNNPRASAEEMYAQIASDLKLAIEKMPSTPKVSERGRATKWAAQGILARAFLFYTGYYKKDSMPLVDEGSLTKAEVIAFLDDCIANSGHGLYPDFRNLWPYSNLLSKRDGYKYSVDNDLQWAGETGGNYETVFAFQSITKVTWDNPIDCNRLNLYFSIREQDEAGIFPYGKGWGFGTVNSKLWDTWPSTDIRRKGSIIDVTDPNEMPGYQWAADHQQHETGFWQKKYVAVNVKTSSGFVNYSKEMFGETVNDDYQINNTQDLIVLRFADILLMAAELKQDAGPLNLVRGRVGLGDVAYSETALRNERRWELAFEGIRYYDLLRWGIAGEALNAQNGIDVKNDNATSQISLGDLAKRITETGGFMPISQKQISLSSGVLKQTPGW
ncbi:MAG: RagB/SusD family nutrient uptake outer membrane protein [Dysgonomonas sp.]